MAFAISTPTSSLLNSSSSSSSSASAGVKTSSFCSLSNSAIQIPRNTISHHSKCISQLGCASFSQWSGLKLVGISTSKYLVKLEKKGKCKGKGVYASLFGVGAPEVLVIGVVALLVFGPKGLAEVARNLGQTLRAFQPTIRELQEVSREFKSTLEREIGLDDIDKPLPKSSGPNTTKPTSEAALEDLGTNIEPNGSSSEDVEDSSDKYLNVKADRFRGALAQLQKEQEEEEREKAQLQEETELKSESQTPSSQDTPQATEVDTQEASSVTKSPSENVDKNDALQEAASVASVGPAPTTETQI